MDKPLKKCLFQTRNKQAPFRRWNKWNNQHPLGTGSVDFDKYLRALEDIGYRGFLTIEREVGDNPEADIYTAKHYLETVIARN